MIGFRLMNYSLKEFVNLFKRNISAFTYQKLIHLRIRLPIYLGVFLFLFINPFVVDSQRPLRYMVESLDINKNLNSSDISALFQDKDGFIWVGTKPGISRYDGYDFQNFTKAGDHYLGQIHDIAEDNSGTLWIGGINGLFYFQDGRFHSVLLEKNNIRTLHIDKNKELWVGGLGFVPFVLSQVQLSKLKQNQSVAQVPIVSVLEWKKKISSLRVWDIDTDDNGHVWLGLDNQRASFDEKQLNVHWEDRNTKHEYCAIAAINKDSVFWGSEGTGAIFQNGNKSRQVTESATYSFCETDTSLYFLTTMELVELKQGKWDTLHTFSTYSHLYFKEMILDKEGNFWIGANGNLLKLTPSYFQNWSVESNNLLHSNHSIAQLSNGDLIVGSSKEKILKFENNDFVPFSRLNVPLNSFTGAIFPDDDWIWYATSMSGIIRQREGVSEYFNLENGLRDKGQYFFYKSSKEALWSGGENGITNIINDQLGNVSFINYIVDLEGEDFPLFLDLSEGPDGTIWAISDKGLFCLKNNILRRWAFPGPATLYPIITGIKTDSNNQLWLSTQGEGLWQCQFNKQNEPELIRQYTIKDGLLSNVILDIHQDKNNQLWLVSQNGICNLDFGSTELICQCYDQNDGWPNAPSSHYQLLESKDGMLWAVGSTSISRFPLYKMPKNKVNPQTFITDIQLFDGKEDIYQHAENSKDNFQLPKNLLLPHNKNFLRFYYTTTSHTKSGKNTFRFMLEGLDPEWNEGNINRSIMYPGLQSGTFTFKVQAKNNDGLLGSDFASFSFEILSPWYLRWWAIFGFACLLSSIFWFSYKFRQRRRKAEQETLRLKELDAFKTRFYSNITHEFRTPLTVIQGMADELEKHPDQQSHKKLSLIKKNSRNLLSLVNQMLDLSRLQAGKITPDLKQEDAITFLKYLVESHESFAKLQYLGLQFYTEEQEIVMDFDAKKVERVITNLLSNAIKFTPEHGKILVVAKKVKKGGQAFLQVKVKDSGIGISPEQLTHIFDRFHQVNAIYDNQGTGIGLALVKELTEIMHGSIEVESELDKGSTFLLSIPIQNKAPLNVKVSQHEFTPLPVSKISKKQELILADNGLPILLIIEDNVDVTYYLQTCLEDQYQILTRRDGKSGVVKALEVLPDIIISDVMMPEMDGFEVCKILKEDERTSHIPIILLTAKATAEDKLEGLTQGADAYLTKPFEKEELMIRLNNLMDVRHKLQKKYSSSLISSHSATKPIETKEDTFIEKVEKIILGNIEDEDFSVNELARTLLLSRSQVHRKIKALTGMSTAIYIRSVRLRKSKELLPNEELSISEIAYQVGFKSPVYFSQVFKETFGMSPSATRK